MKKTLISILILCITSLFASAQWKVEHVGSGEPNTTLLQVLETENSMLVYATFSKHVDSDLYVTIDRNICVKAGGLKYKALNSVNIPIKDDADRRYMMLQKGDNEVNFVLEFEKFPVEDGFDIIENQKDGEWNFNFHDVRVTPIDASKVIDTERFLNSAAPVIAGKYTDNGHNYTYYIREDVCVTCNAVSQKGGLFTDDEIFYVSIVNNSDHGVMFDFDKVRIEGERSKANGTTERSVWTKYTPESYEDFYARMDYEEARYQSAGIYTTIGDQINREKRNAEPGSWERVGWEALGALNQQAMQNRIGDYLRNHPKNRPSALKSQGVKAGESIHGYIASKKQKKDDSVDLTIHMDDFDFRFSFNIK